jgi:hypothetical protein
MKATLVLAMLGCLLPYMAGADEGGGSTDQSVKFDFGTTLNVVLSDSLDARKSKPGDVVKAKVAEDLQTGGDVVIPRGARLLGHVTQAQAGTPGEGRASLGLTFDRAELKDGRRIPLHAALYALAAPEGASGDHGGSASGGGFNGVGFGGAANAGSIVSNAGHAATDDASALGAGGTNHEELKPSVGAIGGVNSKGTLYASSRGVFGLEDLSLQPDARPGGASSVILSTSRTVHLASGTRMLVSVESASADKAANP